MVCAPVRSIIPSLKLGDYLSVQAHKPCSISHLFHFACIGDGDINFVCFSGANVTENDIIHVLYFC